MATEESEARPNQRQRGGEFPPQQNTGGLVRVGILALPISGVLGLVALIGRYGTPNASVDPEAAARSAASLSFFWIQFLGNVLGLTLLIFGIIALTVFLAGTRAKRIAVAAMILSILGVAPVLSALGVTTYALPVLGKAYLNNQQGVLPIINDIFNNPLRIIFDFIFLVYAAGFILFGVAIWRSGVLRKPAAISLGLHTPLVSSFVKPEPNWSVILGAVLFILGSTFITLDVFRGPPAKRHKPEQARKEATTDPPAPSANEARNNKKPTTET